MHINARTDMDGYMKYIEAIQTLDDARRAFDPDEGLSEAELAEKQKEGEKEEPAEEQKEA